MLATSKRGMSCAFLVQDRHSGRRELPMHAPHPGDEAPAEDGRIRHQGQVGQDRRVDLSKELSQNHDFLQK